ncbi:putative ankyrin repeat protein [Diaporthe ampelina]|uniref:Putative ankyrin repeat protein n=1 Tax=Diaporthe ampelina TaxID=1214573 RepID=A0A0G2FYV5_9PEZI|nr:putative ankyrin repeat protein [Diaporthe ampelina]
MGFKDWKAIFYSEKDAYKSLFTKECRLKIPKDFSTGSHGTMRLHFKSDQASGDNLTAPFQAFIYGNKGIFEKAEEWLGNNQSHEAGKLMLLGLDENDKIKVNLDDTSGILSLAGSALLLATNLATVEETRNVVNKKGKAAIHLAAELTGLDESTVKLLVDKTDEKMLDAKDNEKEQTALHKGAKRGNLTLTERLIGRGASTNIQDSNGRTPLYYAAEKDHHRIVRALLEYKEKHESVSNDEKSGLQDHHGMTALHWAIEAKDEVSAKLLVRSQSDLDVLDHKKRSALIPAADKELNKVVRVLLENNADAKVQDSHQRTVLHWAAMRVNLGIMEQLVHREDIQSYINEADYLGRTALHWAAYQHWQHRSQKSAMKLILESYPQYDTRDNDGCTPLILAAERGNLEPVKQLLDKKADPLTTNKEGLAALDQAAINGHGDLVAEPIGHVHEDKVKMKALELAVDHKHLSVAIKLQKSITDRTLQRMAELL